MRVSESVTVPNDLRPQVILTRCGLPLYGHGSPAFETVNHLPKVTVTTKHSSVRTQIKYYFPDALGHHSHPVMGSHSSLYCFMDLFTIVIKVVMGK